MPCHGGGFVSHVRLSITDGFGILSRMNLPALNNQEMFSGPFAKSRYRFPPTPPSILVSAKVYYATFAEYFVAALSNSELFSSKSFRNACSGDEFLNELLMC